MAHMSQDILVTNTSGFFAIYQTLSSMPVVARIKIYFNLGRSGFPVSNAFFFFPLFRSNF